MLTDQEIDALVNASREADEGPLQFVRRVERAVLAQQPAASGEPAGWVHPGALLSLKQGAAYSYLYATKSAGASRALYAAPQPAPALTRYSAVVEHGEVHHEPDPDGMWVMFDDLRC